MPSGICQDAHNAGQEPLNSGLTKLEHFAGLAMQGILSNPESMATVAQVSEGKDYEGSGMVASLAISQAKALLAQLEEKDCE